MKFNTELPIPKANYIPSYEKSDLGATLVRLGNKKSAKCSFHDNVVDTVEFGNMTVDIVKFGNMTVDIVEVDKKRSTVRHCLPTHNVCNV
jgi:hypothetical protein